MTCSERLYTAMSGGVPDRVPYVPKVWVDLAAEILGEDLLETAGSPGKALDATARAALELGLDGARLFHFPERRLSRDREGRPIEVDDRGNRIGSVDYSGGLATRLEGANHFDLRDPYHTAFAQFKSSDEPFVKNLADAKALAVPDRRFWEGYGAMERTKKALAAYGEKVALIGDLGSATLSYCVCFRGLERLLFDLLEAPELIHALVEKGTETAIERAKFNLDAGIKILRLNDSTGTTTLISPETWREFVYPGFRDVAAAVKAHDPSARIYCHICGNVLPIAADLVKAGIDCIAPPRPARRVDAGKASGNRRGRGFSHGRHQYAHLPEGEPGGSFTGSA